jgi:UDPglucose 6-dehydrogenase/GDP-mannose 6-dehydrogenase
MKVAVVGTGYVGLVSGVCLAERGHQVVCVDVDPRKVEMINRGVPPIHEHGLEALLRKNVGTRLRATTDLARAIQETDVSLIAVGTPFNGREIDLTQVKTVATQIGTALRGRPEYHVVVVKSTVVPGTTDRVVRPLLEEASSSPRARRSPTSWTRTASCWAAWTRRASRRSRSCTPTSTGSSGCAPTTSPPR